MDIAFRLVTGGLDFRDFACRWTTSVTTETCALAQLVSQTEPSIPRPLFSNEERQHNTALHPLSGLFIVFTLAMHLPRRLSPGLLATLQPSVPVNVLRVVVGVIILDNVLPGGGLTSQGDLLRHERLAFRRHPPQLWPHSPRDTRLGWQHNPCRPHHHNDATRAQGHPARSDTRRARPEPPGRIMARRPQGAACARPRPRARRAQVAGAREELQGGAAQEEPGSKDLDHSATEDVVSRHPDATVDHLWRT
jgi:hypothetical protein